MNGWMGLHTALFDAFVAISLAPQLRRRAELNGIPGPSQSFVFLDERMDSSINDGYFNIAMDGFPTTRGRST